MEIEALASGALVQHLWDVKGSDPFFSVFGGHSHREIDPERGFGTTGDCRGVLLGGDMIRPLGDGHLRFGLAVVRGEQRMRFSFPEGAADIARRSRGAATQSLAFAAYERLVAQRLQGNLALGLGYGHGRTDGWRSDSEGEYASHFRTATLHFFTEGTQNFHSLRGLQIGPWFGFHYLHAHQNTYRERHSYLEYRDTTFQPMDHALAHVLFGVNVDRELAPGDGSQRRIRLHGRAGVKCRILRRHSDGTALRDGLSYPYDVRYVDGKQNAFVFDGGFRSRLSPHWEIRGQWHCSVDGGRIGNFADFSVGYLF
jgi:outer membrane autotransporter protein